MEAITDIDQAVMLSAIGKSMCAWPRELVISSGFQSSVSGKYLRRRGVKRGFGTGAVPWSPLSTTPDTSAESVAIVVTASAVTVTSVLAPETFTVASSFVVEPNCTGTLFAAQTLKPGATTFTSYMPAEMAEKT